MSINIVGLDIESSDSALARGATLIQIGVEWPGKVSYGETLLPPDFGSCYWNPEAAAVHNIPRYEVEAAPLAADVDADLEDRLRRAGAKDKSIIPVGWNVGSFDMPFVRKYLPLTSALISYRSLDLNAVCFFLGQKTPWNAKTRRNWSSWKRDSKTYGEKQLIEEGIAINKHNALYDAQEALKSLEYLYSEVVPNP